MLVYDWDIDKNYCNVTIKMKKCIKEKKEEIQYLGNTEDKINHQWSLIYIDMLFIII